MEDLRIPLPFEIELQITSPQGGTLSLSGFELAGRGGSCLVYRARNSSSLHAGRTQIVKEFYPLSIPSIRREGTRLTVPDADRALFDRLAERFFSGVSQYIDCYEWDDSHTSARPFLCGPANGTVYSVSDPSRGVRLCDEKRGLTLCGVAEILCSLCAALQAFHKRGLLYLDCKPENILLCRDEQHCHVQLFDFDTVADLGELRGGQCPFLSWSDGWAPPEQVHGQLEALGPSTDLYAAGAVFFYLLTGKKPRSGSGVRYDDLKQIERGIFPWRERSELLRNCSDEALRLVEEIAFQTLRVSPSARCQEASALQEKFQALISVTRGTPASDQPIYDILRELKSLSCGNLTAGTLECISSPQLKQALLKEAEKLAQYQRACKEAERDYEREPSPFLGERLHIAESAVTQQEKKLDQLQRDMICNIELILEYRSGDELDGRGRQALDAAAQGDYARSNAILRDPGWAGDIQAMDTILQDMGNRCLQYISGQKLLISNLRATGLDQRSCREILDIYETITGLSEKYQTAYSTFHDYISFLLSQQDYERGMEKARRLCRIYALRADVSDADRAHLDTLLGELHFWLQNYDKSVGFYDLAAEIYERDPEKHKRPLLHLYNDMAHLFWMQSQYMKAKDKLEAALSLYESLPSFDDGSLMELADIYNRRGIIYNKMRMLDTAERYHLSALYLKRKLRERSSADDLISSLALSCSNLGILYRRMGRYKSAEDMFQEAFRLRLEGFQRNRPRFIKGLAITCSSYAFMLADAGRPEEAEELIRKYALPLKQELADCFPQSCEKTYSITLVDYGFVLSRFRDPEKREQAGALFQEAIEIQSRLMESGQRSYARSISEGFLYYARWLNQSGRVEDSRRFYQKALELYRDLEERDLGCYLFDIMVASSELADMLRRDGRDLEESERCYREALACGEILMERRPQYHRANYMEILRGLLEVLPDTPEHQAERVSLTAQLSALEAQEREAVP